MFESLKAKREARLSELKLYTEANTLAIKQNQLASSALDKIYEANNTVVDEDVKGGWFLIGGESGGMTEVNHTDMLGQAYKFYHDNPHGRAIIRSLVKFVFGKGPTIVPKEEKNTKKVKETWEEFKRLNKWNIREKEIGTRTFRDGEVFLRLYLDKFDIDGTIAVRFIRAGAIATPRNLISEKGVSFGIKTDPDDIEEVQEYYRTAQDGTLLETIPADEIIHLKILSDSDQKRGISILRVCAKRLTQYNEWLEDRIVLNKIRSAIALVREVDSSSPKVQSISDQNRSDIFSNDRNKQKMPKSGTIITAGRGITYKMLSPNINASDVGEDGRSILLSIAAGVGMPEMILTADWSNSNYSSSLIAQNPWVREIEDWQDFFTDFYKQMHRLVIENKIENGGNEALPADTNTECDVIWPPMITADIDKMAKAYEVLYKYKILSKKTWRNKMGLEDDVEQDQIDDEGVDDFIPGTAPGSVPGGVPGQSSSPFNMPLSPINQFGHALIEAVRNSDWEAVLEIGERLDDEYGILFEEEDEGQKEDDYSDEEVEDELFDDSELLDDFESELFEGSDDEEVEDEDLQDEIQEARRRLDILEQREHELELERIRATGGMKQEFVIQTPEVHTTVNTPDVKPTIEVQPADVKVTVEATEINIENQMPEILMPEQKPPIVNIDQPIEINVEKQDTPVVNVTVENKTEKPAKIIKKVLRDKEGNITGIEEG